MRRRDGTTIRPVLGMRPRVRTQSPTPRQREVGTVPSMESTETGPLPASVNTTAPALEAALPPPFPCAACADAASAVPDAAVRIPQALVRPLRHQLDVLGLARISTSGSSRFQAARAASTTPSRHNNATHLRGIISVTSGHGHVPVSLYFSELDSRVFSYDHALRPKTTSGNDCVRDIARRPMRRNS